jgi:hypothetical protein
MFSLEKEWWILAISAFLYLSLTVFFTVPMHQTASQFSIFEQRKGLDKHRTARTLLCWLCSFLMALSWPFIFVISALGTLSLVGLCFVRHHRHDCSDMSKFCGAFWKVFCSRRRKSKGGDVEAQQGSAAEEKLDGVYPRAPPLAYMPGGSKFKGRSSGGSVKHVEG